MMTMANAVGYSISEVLPFSAIRVRLDINHTQRDKSLAIPS